MTLRRFTLGIDFGTESARGVLVDVAGGEVVAQASHAYTHGVMTRCLPSTSKPALLPPDTALQHPLDYMEAFISITTSIVAATGVDPTNIVGIGIDATSCSVLPVTRSGVPLCTLEPYAHSLHSWVKLWKHHSATAQAATATKVAQDVGADFLWRYGGQISVEWALPKLLETAQQAPDVYRDMDNFVEVADWIVWQLTGTCTRNRGGAGYKALWNPDTGYPTDYFGRVDGRLLDAQRLLAGDVLPYGSCAGGLTAAQADACGLLAGTAVAVGIIDAHAALPAVGVDQPGTMVMTVGTSTCHMILDRKEASVDGIFGVVRDGMMPGYFAYEAGQAAVGDAFAWFVERLLPGLPGSVKDQSSAWAETYARLGAEATALEPGASGLLALDWWNGNRSILADPRLSGLLLGLTTTTTQAEIYRALLESAAYGTRKIVEAFEQHAIHVSSLVACGGLASKNPLFMQVCADVSGRPIRVSKSTQVSALGAAIWAAVAAGSHHGGYDTVAEAVSEMADTCFDEYTPDASRAAAYDALYREYERLHDYFGRGENTVMHALHELRHSAGHSAAAASRVSERHDGD